MLPVHLCGSLLKDTGHQFCTQAIGANYLDLKQKRKSTPFSAQLVVSKLVQLVSSLLKCLFKIIYNYRWPTRVISMHVYVDTHKQSHMVQLVTNELSMVCVFPHTPQISEQEM